ncbi:MAG: OadG family protein [Prevotellaceae bacterium]|nr:OadG family protein [Prevotellaceae bacterium]
MMMILLAINWSDAFTVMGLGLLIVFAVLILLVFLLDFSGWIFTRTQKVAPQQAEILPAAAGIPAEEEQAAIAMALHLFYAAAHDEESYVITIDDHRTAWNLTNL